METKFTKGEWKIATISPYLPPNVICKKKTICTFIDSGVSLAQKEANAKLIAAAPDLFEALVLLKDKLQMYYETRTGFSDDLKHINIAKQAIKKATE